MVVVLDRSGTQSPSRRLAAIALTSLLHVLVLAMLLLPSAQALPARSHTMLAAFDAANEGAPQPAVHTPPQPRKVVPPPPRPFVAPPPSIEIPQLSPVVATMLAQAEAQVSTGGCDLTGPVQAALQTSDAVQRALPEVPEQRRSVANAIALWDRAWVQPDAMLAAPTLDTIRTTIVATIAAASPACRMQQQAGPRLIYVPGPSVTTVLALGSGQWTWQQVADSAQADLALASDPASADAAHRNAGMSSTPTFNP